MKASPLDQEHPAGEHTYETGTEIQIRAVIEMCCDYGYTYDQTAARIISSFSLSENEAEKYMAECWNRIRRI